MTLIDLEPAPAASTTAPAHTAPAAAPFEPASRERTYGPAHEPFLSVVERQAQAAYASAHAIDPQTWLFEERDRLGLFGVCDPYAQQMLQRAGFLTGR